MLAINYPRAYDNTGAHAAFRVDQSRRPARDLAISVVDGKLALGGVRYPLFFTPLVEGSALPKVDSEARATLKRIVADGYNGLYLRDITERKWTESAFNWGVWKYDNTDASYANRWEMEEAALVQLDKMIAWALDEGIECICVDLEGYDEIILRHPNQRPQGSYQGRGMQWSSEYRQMAWDVNSRIFTRVSTITGIRHCDNRRVIWKFSNENGFGDVYTRATTSAWGGGSSVHWFDKIIEGVTDTFGDNGYWYPELCAKLTAWRDANAPSWTIPAWGRGSSGVADGVVGAPKRNTWYNWATGADPASDRARMIDFIDAMDYEAACDQIARCLAVNPAVILNTGTQSYHSPRANFALPAQYRNNIFAETHLYFSDNGGVGVKTGSAVTRRSCMDPTWAFVTNGGGWAEMNGGTRAQHTAFIASECNQYSPNRWRYQRLYYEMLLALVHGYDISDFNQSQQYSAYQFVNDGRYPMADHVTNGSPCARLTARAIAPALRYGFLSEHAQSFVIQSRIADVRAYQYSNKSVGVQGGNRMNPNSVFDGTQNDVWGTRKIFWEIDDSLTPTTDFTNLQVTNTSMAAGVYIRNTATEKVYVKRPEGAQLMTPYMCGFIDTLRAKAAADAIFPMPMYLSGMAAAVSCAVCFLRSDGLWPLFTGPMKLYIHGSDFGDEVVNQGLNVTGGTIGGVAPGAYGQGAPDAFASHNPPGAAYFMANDQVQVWYSGASSQSWGNGSGSAATVRLMMPETFTVNLDTSGAPGAFANVELEVFKVDKDGIPSRVATSFAAGVTSFAYDATCPEYTIQPAAKRNTMVRARR